MPGNDSFTKLLLHCNGSDTSTTFTDDSASGHIVTANGNSQIDTAQSKFGGASGLFDNVGDYLSVPDSADWDFGSGDFTIDCWVRFIGVVNANTFCSRSTSGTSYFYFAYETDGGGQLRFRDFNNDSPSPTRPNIARAWTPSLNTWYHVAVSRSGDDFRLFIDGVQQGATVTSTGYSFLDRSAELQIGAFSSAGTTYDMNGHIDEFRWSKGVARYTGNFTPATGEYDNITNDSFSASVLDVVSSVVAPSFVIDCTVSPSVLDASSEVLAPDVGNIEIINPSALDVVSSVISPTVIIDCLVTPSVIDVVSSVLSPTFPGLNGASYATRILSLNPLLFVTNTSPAELVKVDTTDPENITWDTVILTGIDYALDATIDELSEFIYVGGDNGKVVKVDINNLATQTLIDLSDTDSILTMQHFQSNGITYAGTENTIGELYLIDERETAIMDSDFQVLSFTEIIMESDFRIQEGKIIESSFTVLSYVTGIMTCDFKCLTQTIDSIVPIKRTEFVVFIDNVQLHDTDVDLSSIKINHTIDSKSTADFKLNRRHDRMNTDLQGNTRTITNQNTVRIEIQGTVEFEGKISNIDCQYNNSDHINITAEMTQPEPSFNQVNLSLPSLNKRLSLYDVLIQNPRIYNPYIDPDEENPIRYKGIHVELGTQEEESLSRYSDVDSFGTYAEEIQDGTFITKQNWTYFWSPTVIKPQFFASFVGGNTLGKQIPEAPDDSPFSSLKLPIFSLPSFQFPSSIASGETILIHFLYIGTSLAPVSEDLWVLKYANHRRQRIWDNIISELGVYEVGVAPFKNISCRNGVFIPKYKWSDEDDGLYSIKDAGYDFINYAKRVADLEYQKLLNINGTIFPETSCNLDLTIDGYYYFGLKLLTRCNIDNTTEAGIFKNNNGFPVGIKSITIDSSTMKVSIQADNIKSSIELEEIDGLFPDEDSLEFNTPEDSIFVAQKSDMNTMLKVE